MDAVGLLADLIRTPSVNPDADGEGAVAERLRAELDAAGVLTDIQVSPGGRPSLIARLEGPTDRPPLVLLSHTDVVPVEASAWSRDPFGGEVVDGALWGRGALDMKGVAVMHAHAVAALAARPGERSREVVLVAVADEEAGGEEGAGWLVRERPELVGLRDGQPPPEVLGEGAYGLSGLLARPVMPIVLGEKTPLQVRARAVATPGHGALPPDRQAIRNLARFVQAVSGPRNPRLHPVMREQFTVLAETAGGPQGRLFQLLAGPLGPRLIRPLAPVLRARAGAIGHVVADTVTPTMLQAGYAGNVVPGEASAQFDCRLLPDADPDRVLFELRVAGRRLGIEVDEVQRLAGGTSDRTPLFDAVAHVSARLPTSPVPVPSLTPGATDLRFFRAAGATGIGWVPLVLDPELLATFHGHDERVPLEQFSAAVEAVTEVVRLAATA
ncbi:M20/M25/M40 family metallo-hydrolase [Egicoccus sp. AB-alg2]|uniref:M20/M25/M40 family metallo-hydrolase n=1 Tax=Egicoccus sp. AB-alg2 TaxID=3242693 RepID=UPI00359D136B